MAPGSSTSRSRIPAMARGEQWTWSIRLKTDPDRTDRQHQPDARRREPRLLARPAVARPGTDDGGGDAVTDFWFDVLQFPVLRVPKAIANTASRRVSEKQGMRVVAIGRARLRLRPIAGGDLGNHRGGMAGTGNVTTRRSKWRSTDQHDIPKQSSWLLVSCDCRSRVMRPATRRAARTSGSASGSTALPTRWRTAARGAPGDRPPRWSRRRAAAAAWPDRRPSAPR